MKKILVILLFNLACLGLKAQSGKNFHDQRHLTYIVKYSPEGDAEVNKMMALLAQAQGMRPGSFAEIPLEFDLLREISARSRTEYLAGVRFTSVRNSRSIVNKGFALDELIQPVSVRFSMKILNGKPGFPVPEYKKELAIQNGNTSDANVVVQDSGAKQMNLEVSEVEFLFAPFTSGKIRDRLALIQNYYSSDAILTGAEQQLRSILPVDMEHLDAQTGILSSVEQQLMTLELYNFSEKLDLFNHDPIHFNDRYQNTKQHANEIKERLLEARANLYLFFFQRGMDLLSHGRRNFARESFRRSLVENPRFAPAAYQLAEMDYEEGNIGESECRLLEILGEMNPDPDTRRNTTQLAGSIYDYYLRQADVQFNSRHLESALDFLNKANHLCFSMGALVCDRRLEDGYKKVRTAIYTSMIDDSKRYYQQGDLDQTEQIVLRAISFQKQFPRDVNFTSEATEMLNQVRQKKYERKVLEGKSLFQERQYKLAVQRYEAATDYQKQYGLIADPDINSLLKLSAKPVLMSMFATVQEYTGKNDLASARKLTRESMEFQNKYGLQEDKEVQESLKKVQAGIFSQECQNSQLLFDTQMQELKNALSSLDYLKAETIILQAQKILSENEQCSLNDGGLSVILDSIRPAISYEHMIEHVFELQNQKRYQEAVDAYSEAGSYFDRSTLAGFGLRHAGFTDFAFAKMNNNFLIFLADRYTSAKELEKSLEVIRQLLSRSYAPGFYKDELSRLGLQLGIRDKALTGGKDWKSAALKYTQGDKRLKVLERAFKKGWKQG
ncbi:MAG TPA: hypothetical protein PKK99_05335 [Bacteroidia bacterium]|mgnify:CR=1 FL=1|nr:hypothetical protein [Bacteroidia bacterium]HNP98454.1 hypothetical protein [Bacteroidia bacterium]